ncbi:MAG TPA: hemerythrin domain-containing protein [Polyangia bacterium]|nr:hemerythrin domain-containing protein [Polyangia bacterium]
MNAIEMLKQQHREVDELFKKLNGTKSAESGRRIFNDIADALAVHAAIEERHFYPAVKRRETQGILLASVEEHLEIKRVIADLLQMDPDDDAFDSKVEGLREDVERHVEEEEGELFPKVARLFDEEELEAIGDAMRDTQDELRRQGNPRHAIPGETDAAAPI